MTLQAQIDQLEREMVKRHERQLEILDRAYLEFVIAQDIAENWTRIEDAAKHSA